MDDRGVERLKIAQILPEFEEGGVERHVLWLSNALAEMGHEITVITAGGKLEEKLDPKVAIVRLPVHRKNPLTAIYCALSIATRAKREGWDILHAHSRVPAWITSWASRISKKPWVFTAHDRYRRNWAIKPFSRADGAICVSGAVMTHLNGFLPERSVVIRNGIPFSGETWSMSGSGNRKLLFVGRLTRRKGLHIALQALALNKGFAWTLDILGDGPQRKELEEIVLSSGLSDRIVFHGFCDDPQQWMAKSDFLLFPSFDEGMPLVLMQAVQVGLPVLASDIEPVRELVGGIRVFCLRGM